MNSFLIRFIFRSGLCLMHSIIHLLTRFLLGWGHLRKALIRQLCFAVELGSM
jgi:hypothetical protein